jgi:hypothetical protein
MRSRSMRPRRANACEGALGRCLAARQLSGAGHEAQSQFRSVMHFGGSGFVM